MFGNQLNWKTIYFCCKMWRVVIWVRFRIYSEIKQTLSKLYLNSSCSSLQSVRLFISFRLELRQYLQYQLSLNKLQQHSHSRDRNLKNKDEHAERVKWNLSVVADTFLLEQIIKYSLSTVTIQYWFQADLKTWTRMCFTPKHEWYLSTSRTAEMDIVCRHGSWIHCITNFGTCLQTD